MSTEPNKNDSEKSQSNAFNLKVTIGVATIAVAIWVLGFLVLPVIDVNNVGIDSFTAICRAIGIGPREAAPVSAVEATPASGTAWNAATRSTVRQGDAVKGAAIAQETCIGCHDPNGLSVDPATTPSTTGQAPRAIYKQLQDMKAGQRVNEVMAPLLADLTDQQMADLAAYYSGLPQRNHDIRALQPATASAVRLVTKGDPARTLPACDACHSVHAGGPLEAPMLTGQYPGYIAAQLKAYASGARKNDLYSRMRNIAVKLTDQEIAEISAYYDAPR